MRGAITALVVTLLALLGGPAAIATAAVPPPTDPPVVTANPFLPEEQDLSECMSAVPAPDCGSEARGGWRQGLVFAVVVVALAFVGWRVVRIVRRSRRELESAGGR